MIDHYHFIGIGGIGMSALAYLLLQKKYSVSGSDLVITPLIQRLAEAGAHIYREHASKNIIPNTYVIYSSDIRKDNVEYQAAIELQCHMMHRADLLAQLTNTHRSLAVAGTHGKTTTSSLLASVLINANLDPSYAIGGIVTSTNSNVRCGVGDYFVFEADESDRTFLKYNPFGAIITNIDADHLSQYDGDEQNLIKAFNLFISQVQSELHLFWCGDDVHLSQLHLHGQSYGFKAHCDWKITSFDQDGFSMHFDVEHRGSLYPHITLPLIGLHNILNATAVFGLALSLGIPEKQIRESFQMFQGVRRRMELKGSHEDILFFDDYAHHPTEIQTTLQGLRSAIGSKRLIAVFQPHRYSRTQECLGLYRNIFDTANHIVLTDIYGSGEAPIPHITHSLIQQELAESSSVSCQYVPRSALGHYLSCFVQSDDVVISLGAGDITKVSIETLSCLAQTKSSH